MEMEETFLQLCTEVARLQELCAKQGKLLQKLLARKGPALDLPVSLPIQCTEDTATEEGERPPPGSHQKCSKAPQSTASDLLGSAQPPLGSAQPPLGSAQPLVQPHAAHLLPRFDGQYLTGPTSGSILGTGRGRAALTGASGAVDKQLKTCGVLPGVEAPKGEAGAGCSPKEPVAAVGSLLTLPEAPEALQREDAPLPAGVGVPVEIRGPGKTSWTPGWVLEEAAALGQGSAP